MRRLSLYLCGSAFALVSAPALAQQSSDMPAPAPTAGTASTRGEAGLEDIIVTARRVEENQQKVPVAVTTITGTALQQRNVDRVNDLQFSVPNLQIRQNQITPSIAEFSLRGQRQQFYTDENVVAYVNGVAQGTRALTLYDMQSVQALKGPQGTLFGKNTMGGAMVFTTTRPAFETSGRIELEYGNYDRKTALGIFNTQILKDKIAIRFAGNIERRDGVFKNVFPGGKDANNRHSESARVTLLVKPDDRFESLTTVDYLHRDEIQTPTEVEAANLLHPFGGLVAQGVTQQSALGGGVPALTADAAGNPNALLVRRGNPYRIETPTGIGTTIPSGGVYDPLQALGTYVKSYGISNNTSFEMDDNLTIRNIISYRYERSFDHQDTSGIGGFTLNLGPFFGFPNANIPGHFIDFVPDYNQKDKTFSDELQLIGEYDNFKFIVGGFYGHLNKFFANVSSAMAGPFDFTGAGPRYDDEFTKVSSKAIFGQGTYDFSGVGLEGVRLTLGGRYTWDNKKYLGHNFFSNGNNASFQVWSQAAAGSVCNYINGTGLVGTSVSNAQECAIRAEKTFKAFTWTASLEYQVARNTLVYFANRRGYKAGGPNPTTSNLDFTMWGPERLTDFELGLKHQGYIGSVPYRLNIAAFTGKYSDIQTQDIVQFCSNAACGSTFTDLIIFNVGKARIKGIEVDGSIKPFPELTLDFGYSYQVGRYGKGSVIPQPRDPNRPVNDFADPASPAFNPIDYAGGVSLAGVEFAGVPRQTFTAAASYNATFIPESFAKVVLGANYAARTRTKGIQPVGVYPTPGFDILNARLSFNELFKSDVSLAFWVQNLTKEVYRVSCADNLSTLGFAQCRWGEPRTYGVTGTVRF